MATLAQPRIRTREEPEWVVWLTVAVALVVGLLVQSAVLGRTSTGGAGGSTVAYPERWATTTDDGALFAATDLSGGTYGPRVAIREAQKSDVMPADGTLIDAATGWTLLRRERLAGYRVLGIEEARAAGREAIRVDYVYLASPPQGSASGALPGLMRARDTLVESRDRVYALTVAAEADAFESLTEAGPPRFQSVYDGILASWRVP
jgi:hypothetical protein